MTDLTTRQFHYDSTSRTLSAEASELGGFPPATFLVTGEHRTVEFRQVERDVDADGDLRFVRYTSTDPFTAMSVIVFND